MVSSSHPPPMKHSPISHCLPRPHYPPPPTNHSSLKTTLPLSTSFNISRSPNTIYNPPQPNFCSNPPTTISEKSDSFYMQGRCKNGRTGTNCSFPHPNMCFRFIRSGNKGCNKGSSCRYAHPKLCKASLTSKRCDRCNCYYYHVAGTSYPLTDISVPAHRQLNSKPTPCMQINVPYLQIPISTLPQIVSQLPPKTQVPIPQVSVPQIPVPQVPVNLSPSVYDEGAHCVNRGCVALTLISKFRVIPQLERFRFFS